MRAIISVSDKTGVVDFAIGLAELGCEIVSTGGTAKVLRGEGISVTDVSAVTGFPEILDGRVKTLHPGVHAGILAMDTDDHRKTMKEHKLLHFDIVVVNLYPFEKTISKSGVTWADAIENIDIGGPTMIRAAAKNHERMIVVIDPSDYSEVLRRLQEGNVDLEFRQQLAIKVFRMTGAYDAAIERYMIEHV